MTTSRRRHRSRPVQSEQPEQPISEPAPSEAQVEARREPEPKSITIESLGLEFAGPLRRIYAYAVDFGLLLMCKFVVDSASGQIGFNLDPRRSIFEVAIFLAYFILPTGLFGRTIGKWVAGVSVVDEEGNKPGVALAIPREAVGRFRSRHHLRHRPDMGHLRRKTPRLARQDRRNIRHHRPQQRRTRLPSPHVRTPRGKET